MEPLKDPRLPESYALHVGAPALAAHLWKGNTKLTTAAGLGGAIVRYYRGKNFGKGMTFNKDKILSDFYNTKTASVVDTIYALLELKLSSSK